jgi:vacuolar-type H+-ATPase subunit H
LKAEAKARILEAETKARLLEADAKTKLMAEENKIMLTNLESIIDPDSRDWLENRKKMIWARDA